MDALCYYVCTTTGSSSSSTTSSLLGFEKLRVLRSNYAISTHKLPRIFSLPSVAASYYHQHQSTIVRCSVSKKKKSNDENSRKMTTTTMTTRSSRQQQQRKSAPTTSESSKSTYQNGDPLGRRDLGKVVVKWLRQGMRAMAAEFAAAEVRGDFSELEQRMGPGVTFLIEAQPYLSTVPMPLGLETVCLKACAHYPTLLDHFQRELREVLFGLQTEAIFEDWRQTRSWKLLKQLATSGPIYCYLLVSNVGKIICNGMNFGPYANIDTSLAL